MLVLVALGGAGLTTAADRPATDASRPELSARTDKLATPWLDAMKSQAHAVEGLVDALSQHGRNVLTLLERLEPQKIDDELAAGDESSTELELAAGSLGDQRVLRPDGIDETRLSEANRQILAAVDVAIGAGSSMSATWRGIATDTREVTALLAALIGHDGLVFRATTDGRQGDWGAALRLLRQADDSLADARAARDRLAQANMVETLDDLLARYAAYDVTLTDLYGAMRDGARPDSQQVIDLIGNVDRAQQALPSDTGALKVAITEASGSSVAEGVVSLEEARGLVTEAMAAVP